MQIDPSSSINNIMIANGVKIAKRVSAFGSREYPLIIGDHSYIGMNTILNGYSAQLTVGHHVSFAQNVNVMVDSGPNASEILQKIFPLEHGPVTIGNHCWIGASAIVMPNVILGDFCIVAANSFVNNSFPNYSIVGGTPARLIRRLRKEEIEMINNRV